MGGLTSIPSPEYNLNGGNILNAHSCLYFKADATHSNSVGPIAVMALLLPQLLQPLIGKVMAEMLTTTGFLLIVLGAPLHFSSKETNWLIAANRSHGNAGRKKAEILLNKIIPVCAPGCSIAQ